MAVLCDYHVHSSFSEDSDAPMEAMVRRGIELGLSHMCFTEHMDMDFPVTEEYPAGAFEVNTDSYLYDCIKYREKYAREITVNWGIELGLQPQLFKEHALYIKNHDFDFVIASSHICNKKDPYYPSFYEGRSEEEAYREYFQSIIDNIRKFDNFDVYGHLDYVVRYGPNADRDYSYEKYKDLLDTILNLLIDKEKGLELNTSGMRYGLKELHPATSILQRYKELGGEIITVGSDAHSPANLGSGFDSAAKVLKDVGFRYYTIFEKRVPEFKRI